jgi:hypothetical protein
LTTEEVTWEKLATSFSKLFSHPDLNWLTDLLHEAAASLPAVEPVNYASGQIDVECRLWNRACRILDERRKRLWWINILGIMAAQRRRQVFDQCRIFAALRAGQAYRSIHFKMDALLSPLNSKEITLLNEQV